MALRLGSPLPETTPGPLLDRLLYHEEKRRHHRASRPTLSRATTDTEKDSDDDSLHHKVEGAAIGTRLTFDVLKVRRLPSLAETR